MGEQWHTLTAAETALILQHLPLHDRLAAASVCQTWAAAAVLATSSIKVREALPAWQVPGLQWWLQQHGQQLTSLELAVFFTPRMADNVVLQLPELCQLCSLKLAGCRPQLPSVARRSAQSAAHAPAALMPHLTSLQLGGFVLSTPSTLLQLTRITSLRSLKLGAPYTSKEEICLTLELQQQPQPISQALSTVLQHNTQLTQLYVWGLVFEDAALAAVSSLQGLQDCCVGIRDSGALVSCFEQASSGLSTDLLGGLPASLTSLEVRDLAPRFADASRNTLPRQLPQLTALKQLKLHNARFNSSALAAMLQLRELRLECCSFPNAVAGVDVFTQEIAAFLAAVGQMQQLQVLAVQYQDINCPEVPVQSYSALTASTRLQHLDLCVEGEPSVPLGAVRHMFPAGRQLSQLTYIDLQGLDHWSNGDDEYPEEPCMTSAELASLISCCPALETLRICNALAATADVSPLLQLPPCCTSLLVGGFALGDAAAGVVCQLSQLQQLLWHWSEVLTDRGLEKLTALTRLQELNMDSNISLSECIKYATNGDGETLLLKAKAEGGPPVWQQLRRLCDQSPLCAPVRLQQVSRQLEELQAEVEALRHGNAQLKQQVAQLQGQRQGPS